MRLRLWHDVSAVTRWIGVAFAVAASLLGAALGVLPDLVAGDPLAEDFAPRLISGIVLLVAGLVLLLAGLRLWRHREELLGRRGTAYVIEEIAEEWLPEEKQAFVTDLRTHFPAVRRVPTSSDLGDDWDWPLGDGAERWSAKVDDLVRAFLTVRYNDHDMERGSVIVWARWSVALAFAARASSQRRGAVLRVRQRPSRGREGRLDLDAWRQEPHNFAAPASLGQAGRHRPAPLPPRPLTLLVEPHPGTSTLPAASSWSETNLRSGMEPTLLLVRMTRGRFGDVLSPQTPQEVAVEFTIRDALGVGLQGRVRGQLLEWQCLAEPTPFHDWQDYPRLARSAVEWVVETGKAQKGPLLLAMLVPQEVALGMGVLAANMGEWPPHLAPVHVGRVQGRRQLVIPGLDLGARPDALRAVSHTAESLERGIRSDLASPRGQAAAPLIRWFRIGLIKATGTIAYARVEQLRRRLRGVR